jgi:hypothetical protein
MARKLMRLIGIVGILAMTFSLLFLNGCSREQAPPPVQTPPPAAVAPSPAPMTAQPGTAPAPGAPQAPGAQAPAAGAAAQNIGQVQMGMSPEQVQQLLGAPGQTKQKDQSVEWKYFTPQGKIEVKFQNNQVVAIERH